MKRLFKSCLLAVLPFMATMALADWIHPDGNVTIEAKADKGTVFAGWYWDAGYETPYTDGDVDYRTPKMTYKVHTVGALYAKFLNEAKDTVEIEGISETSYAAKKDLSEQFDEPVKVVVVSGSLPTVTVSNLPAGLKFDAKSLTITGTPTNPGEIKVVKITAKNVSKKGADATVEVKVGDARSEQLPTLLYDKLPGEEGGYEKLVPGKTVDMYAFLQLEQGALDGWTVTGLPKGITFKNGVFSGTATEENKTYTVTFKKGDEMATVTLGTAAMPELKIVKSVKIEDNVYETDPEVLKQFTVTGAGKYAIGKEATLSATAPKGYVFTGWYSSDVEDDGSIDWRTAKGYKVKMPESVTEDGVTVWATFVKVDLDYIEVWVSPEIEVLVSPEMRRINLITGEGLPDDLISDMVDSGSLPTITVTGLPAGFKFDAKTTLLTGAATDKTPKWYDVKVTAKNVSGYTMSATFCVSVNGGEPAEIDEFGPYGFEVNLPDNLYTGIPVDSWQIVPGEIRNVTVKNLPDGLTMAGNAITGTPTKAGVFYVEFTGTHPEVKGKLVLKKRVVVEDDFPIYIKVGVNYPQGGTASGEGIYASGSTMNLTAKPNKDCVFVGWWDDDEDEGILPESADYRQLTYTAIASDYYTPKSFTACFAPKVGDTETEIIPRKWQTIEEDPELVPLEDGEKWTYGDDDFEEGVTQSEFKFEVKSWSLPTVTVKGLPAGVTFNGVKDIQTFYTGDGEPIQVYRICVTDKTKLKPGEYKFTVSAKNQSGAPDEGTYTLKVPNYTCDDLNLDPDETYEVIPGKTFDAGYATAVLGIGNLEDWTVTGLPDGITFKNGEFKGAATKADMTYTVWFVNNGDKNKVATITMHTKAYPELKLELLRYDEIDLAEGVTIPADSAFKLTGGGNAPAGKNMTIKATAPNKEWVFLCWQGDEGPLSWSDTYTYTMTDAETTTLKAVFIHISQDYLTPSEIAGAVYYPDNYNSEESVLKYVALASAVNEEVEIDVTSWFESVTKTTLTFAGLPDGIKYEATSGYLAGKVSKAGCYYGTVTATNKSGYKLVIPVRFAVGDDVDTGEVDENGNLENLHETFDGIQIQVGTCLIADQWIAPMIGYYDKYLGGVKSISGLPDGLKQYARDTGNPDWIEYLLDGKATKPAWYTITYNTNERENVDEKFVAGKAVAKVPVPQLESCYVALVPVGGGTVTGSGVWAPGTEYTITAKPDNGYVFAGWYKNYDEEKGTFSNPANMLASSGKTINDYRTASQKVAKISLPYNAYPELMIGDKLYAKFVPKDEADLSIKLINKGPSTNTEIEDGQTIIADNNGWVSLDFLVESDTAPTVTFVGLPKGVAAENGVDGIHVGTPSSSSSSGETIAAGRYPVKVTIKTSSGQTKIINFTLDVPLYDNNGLFPWEYDYEQAQTVRYDEFVFSMAEPLGEGETWNDKLGLNDELTAETWPDGTKETWTVKNLPNGLIFNAANGLITGSLKAVTTPTEYVVEFANTTKASWGTYTTYSYCRITVEPLPAWLPGTYNGFFRRTENDWDGGQLAKITIDNNGKATMTEVWCENGSVKNENEFSNLAPSEIMEDGAYRYEYSNKSDPYTLTMVVYPCEWDDEEEYGEARYYMEGISQEDGPYQEWGAAYQNVYDRKLTGVRDLSGQTHNVLYNVPMDGTLTLQFGANGKVTPTFKYQVAGKTKNGTATCTPLNANNTVYVSLWESDSYDPMGDEYGADYVLVVQFAEEEDAIASVRNVTQLSQSDYSVDNY